MKKLLVAGITAAVFCGAPALAADMALKAPPPPSAPAYNWTGLYAGLNVGGGWGQANNTFNFTSVATGISLPIATDSSHPDGVIGGGQLGYNWQKGLVVFGIETDIQGSGQRGSASAAGVTTTCGVPCSISETDKLTWFGTTRGRIGVASGGWLAYITGGAAYGGLQSKGSELLPAAAATETFSNSTTRAGWTLGGGLEASLTGNWTWKVEYLYMDFGTANFATASTPPVAAGNITQAMHFTDSILRGGVNLRF
jgi:outer membrane immunogenic protein